jgi:Tol biopolymer transport system component
VTTTQNVQKAAFDPATAVLGEATWLTTGSRRWANPDPSADGSRITLYSQDRPEGDLYVMGGDGMRLRQLTADSAIDRVPRWAPDGSRIAYFSNRGGPLDVWTIRPDGSDNRQLTFGGGGVPTWSPDGSRIVARGPDGNAIVALSGGGSEGVVEWLAPPPATLGRFTANDWSPDGRYIAGSVDYRDTGIVAYSVDSETYDALTNFGHWPVFLPDSRRVLFVSEGHAFHVVDLRTREVVRIYSTPWDVIGPPRLTADARQMLFTRRVTEGDVWLARLR